MAGTCGLLARMIVYVAVIGGSSCVLYGIVTSQKKITPEVHFDGSSCLLFGKWYTPLGLKYGKLAAGGGNGWCKFVEFASASQLALAVLMAVITVIRLIRVRRGSDRDRPSFSSMVELFFVVPAAIVAIIGASIISSGLAIFCSRLLTTSDWNESAYYKRGSVPKPSSCSSAEIATSAKFYKFYGTLNIAQIGMWVTCFWLLHVVLSAVATRQWVRSSRDGNDLAESNTFIQNKNYKKMTDPAVM